MKFFEVSKLYEVLCKALKLLCVSSWSIKWNILKHYELPKELFEMLHESWSFIESFEGPWTFMKHHLALYYSVLWSALCSFMNRWMRLLWSFLELFRGFWSTIKCYEALWSVIRSLTECFLWSSCMKLYYAFGSFRKAHKALRSFVKQHSIKIVQIQAETFSERSRQKRARSSAVAKRFPRCSSALSCFSVVKSGCVSLLSAQLVRWWCRSRSLVYAL